MLRAFNWLPAKTLAESCVSVNKELCTAAQGINGQLKASFNQILNNEMVFRPHFGEEKPSLEDGSTFKMDCQGLGFLFIQE